MTLLKIYLDEECYGRLIEDAGRNLRGAGPHAKALLRLALGLEFPYPREVDMKKPCESFDPLQGHGATTTRGLNDAAQPE
jgi:hypothetical protein